MIDAFTSTALIPIMVLLLILAVWSGFGHHGLFSTIIPRARNLYLGATIQVPAVSGVQPQDCLGYVLSLDQTFVTLVSPMPLTRGVQIDVAVGSLPAQVGSLRAEVLRRRALKGVPKSYLVYARLSPLPSEAKAPFRRFIAQLGQGRHMTTA